MNFKTTKVLIVFTTFLYVNIVVSLQDEGVFFKDSNEDFQDFRDEDYLVVEPFSDLKIFVNDELNKIDSDDSTTEVQQSSTPPEEDYTSDTETTGDASSTITFASSSSTPEQTTIYETTSFSSSTVSSSTAYVRDNDVIDTCSDKTKYTYWDFKEMECSDDLPISVIPALEGLGLEYENLDGVYFEHNLGVNVITARYNSEDLDFIQITLRYYSTLNLNVWNVELPPGDYGIVKSEGNGWTTRSLKVSNKNAQVLFDIDLRFAGSDDFFILDKVIVSFKEEDTPTTVTDPSTTELSSPATSDSPTSVTSDSSFPSTSDSIFPSTSDSIFPSTSDSSFPSTSDSSFPSTSDSSFPSTSDSSFPSTLDSSLPSSPPSTPDSSSISTPTTTSTSDGSSTDETSSTDSFETTITTSDNGGLKSYEIALIIISAVILALLVMGASIYYFKIRPASRNIQHKILDEAEWENDEPGEHNLQSSNDNYIYNSGGNTSAAPSTSVYYTGESNPQVPGQFLPRLKKIA